MNEEINAHQAQLLLDNEVFKQCLIEVKKGIDREMDKVKPNDKETMQSLVLLRQASTRIIDYIATVAETKKITDFNARRKRSLF